MEKLREWTQSLETTEVNIKLPRFKVEDSYDLNNNLTRLGVRDLFSRSKADLSGMSGARDLHVSKIIHKTFIDVNEEGTEAAAATAGFVAYAMLLEEVNFTVDHPFIFIIKNRILDLPLFIGRIISP